MMRLTTWKRILAPTDLSKFAEQAVGYAHRLAETAGAELHVLHVAQDVTQLPSLMPVTGVLDPDHLSDDYHHWLATLMGEPGTVRRVEAVRVAGDVAEAVRKYAEQHEADLIVV